jgi:hypothetical protein
MEPDSSPLRAPRLRRWAPIGSEVAFARKGSPGSDQSDGKPKNRNRRASEGAQLKTEGKRTYGRRSTLPFGLELGTLAGSAVPVLGLAIGLIRAPPTARPSSSSSIGNMHHVGSVQVALVVIQLPLRPPAVEPADAWR